MSGAAAQGELPRRHLVELAASPPSESLPSRPSTPTMEDLELLLASPEPLSRGETEQRGSSRPLVSSASRPEQDTAKRWQQLERQVADLQAEVARLRGHKERCERASLSLLRDLELQRAAQTPEKAALELHGPHNQMQALDRRLVEVREALTEVRRRQALQDAERKGAEQEARVRLAKLTSLLRQEEQAREAACSTLQKGQEDSSQRVDQEVARMQAQVTTLGEEMSLRFLKREAKLCGFLQRSFLALEQRMKASEGARLQAEGSLRQELDGRWQKLQEQSEERAQAQREQEGGRLLAQCRGLDAAVVQLTKFVRQNQVSLNRVLLAEQKARDAKVCLEESQAGELASHVQESLQAVQLAGQRAQQETQGALELVRGRAGLAGTPIPGRGPPAWASSPVFPTAPREEPGPGAGRGRAGPAGGRPGCPLPGPGLQAGPAGADAGAEAVGSADRMGGGREEVPAGPGPVAEGGGRAAGGAAGQSRQPPPAGGGRLGQVLLPQERLGPEDRGRRRGQVRASASVGGCRGPAALPRCLRPHLLLPRLQGAGGGGRAAGAGRPAVVRAAAEGGQPGAEDRRDPGQAGHVPEPDGEAGRQRPGPQDRPEPEAQRGGQAGEGTPRAPAGRVRASPAAGSKPVRAPPAAHGGGGRAAGDRAAPVERGGPLGADAGQQAAAHVPGATAVLRQGRGRRRAGPREPVGRVPGREVAAVEGRPHDAGGPAEAGTRSPEEPWPGACGAAPPSAPAPEINTPAPAPTQPESPGPRADGGGEACRGSGQLQEGSAQRPRPWSPTPFLSASPALASSLPPVGVGVGPRPPGPPRASGPGALKGRCPSLQASGGLAGARLGGGAGHAPCCLSPAGEAWARGCAVQGPLGGQAAGRAAPGADLGWHGSGLPEAQRVEPSPGSPCSPAWAPPPPTRLCLIS
ncbi:coiled-coil domain-containing protein 154 isoform X3 [Oryctolagus cuniculus]|uniref:coiled-coil domain-containing protein 154 isoform X3 n=1 Tax=Oryctolagus cuniculus TaxID=9986 RepID=UPI0038796E86